MVATASNAITTQLAWMIAQLRASTDLTDLLPAGAGSVHSEAAPDGADLPAVIVTLQAPESQIGAVPSARVATTVSWIVKAVDRTDDYGALVPFADAIDAALHGEAGPSIEGTVTGCVQVQPFAMAERTPTDKYRHLGGVYRLVST